MLGHLDHADRNHLLGWAYDPAAPDQPVCLEILVDGAPVAKVLADRYRADLEKAGIGRGDHGFAWRPAAALSPAAPHRIDVRRAADGAALRNSPWVLPAAPLLRGALDLATRERITGWARNDDDPAATVALLVLDNGEPIAQVLANRFRADLVQAGIGDGRHGFDIVIPGGLSPLNRHVLAIRDERNGIDIPGSPVVIEAADRFDGGLEQAVARAVAALADPVGEPERNHQARVLAFLVAQAGRLLSRDSDAAALTRAEQFHRRWQPHPDALPDLAQNHGTRALVIDEFVPRISRDAGSQALLSHMRALQHLGYAISFIAAGEMALTEPALAAAGITCCQAPFYASVEDALRRQADRFDLVYLHRGEVAARYLALARHYFPRARIIVSVADLHHVRLERQAAVEARPELLAASRRIQLTECTAAWSADAVITHSAAEAGLLRRRVPEARVHCVPWDVPISPVTVPFAQRHGVAFIGNYDHAPNRDAAIWLVEAVMPLVRETDPHITCLLAGSSMPEAIRRLAGPGVRAVGQVDDLHAGLLSLIRLTVAPLRFGAGLKGKVLASLAAGVPCVMSPVAAEGFPFTPALLAMIGRDAAALAALICRLHAEETAGAAAVAAGIALVRAAFSPQATITALAAAIGLRHDPSPQVLRPDFAAARQ